MDRPALAVDGLRHVQATALVEWRDAGATDGTYTFVGHAAVFNTVTTIYSGRTMTWNEQIAPGAFASILATGPDVHFNLGHDMNRSMARTGLDGTGSMALSEDAKGLLVNATLDPSDPDVQALAAKMRLGIMDQMSFAFRPGETQTVVTTTDERDIIDDTIVEVADLIDVCVCARGAYPTTDASLRQLATSREAELVALRTTIDTPSRPPSGRSQLIRARAHLLQGKR